MGFPVLQGQAPHTILGYTTVPSPIVFKNNIYSHSTKAYCCFFFDLTEKSRVHKQFHPKYSYSTAVVAQVCSANPKG